MAIIAGRPRMSPLLLILILILFVMCFVGAAIFMRRTP